MYLQHRLCLGEGAVAVAVARLDGNELDVRVARCESLPDVADPLVLIRSAQAGRDDGEVALSIHDPRGFVGERVANALRRRLVDEEVPCAGFGVGVPGYDFDAMVARLAEH